MRSRLKLLATTATIGMFLVLVMGATVTSTGSGEACGRSWPLCHGQFIPEFAVATLIEFSHRAVSGVEGLLIVGLTVAALLRYRESIEMRILAPLALFTVVLQAGLGAWAVLSPQSPAVLASHFGVSLVSFAATFLTAAFIFQAGGADALRDRPVPTRYRQLVWFTLLYVLGVVYLGAFVRHSHVELACTDWPLCDGQMVPPLNTAAGTVFLHRLAALGSVLLLGGIFAWSWRFRRARPDLAWAAAAALTLVLLQSATGAAIVFSRLSLFSALAHAGIMALLFASLSYLCLHVLPRRAPETQRLAARPAPEALPSSA